MIIDDNLNLEVLHLVQRGRDEPEERAGELQGRQVDPVQTNQHTPWYTTAMKVVASYLSFEFAVLVRCTLTMSVLCCLPLLLLSPPQLLDRMAGNPEQNREGILATPRELIASIRNLQTALSPHFVDLVGFIIFLSVGFIFPIFFLFPPQLLDRMAGNPEQERGVLVPLRYLFADIRYDQRIMIMRLLTLFGKQPFWIDEKLNKNNFKKPLLQTIPDLPENQNDYYKNLISIGQTIFASESENDREEVLGIDQGEDSKGLYGWVHRLTHQTQFMMVPEDAEGRVRYYAKLIKLVNHLTLILENEEFSLDAKKDYLKRLATACNEGGCATRWMSEAETMYREITGKRTYETIGDWVHANDADFRRSLIHELNAGGSPNILQASLHSVNQIINIPGGADALDEHMFPKSSKFSFQAEFFLLYTSAQLIEHFNTLINGTLTSNTLPDGTIDLTRHNVEVNKDGLIDWFKANLPEGYSEQQQHMFLSQIMSMEDDPQGHFKAGDIKPIAIEYLLFKCGIFATFDGTFQPEEESEEESVSLTSLDDPH